MSFARTSVLVGACLFSIVAALSSPGCGGSETGGTGGTGGATASSSSTSTSSSTGTGGGPACEPGTTRACYTGPASTKDVGLCKSGTETCAADGSGYGACEGEVLPAPAEDCSTPEDDDCNGTALDASAGCVCTPGEESGCYEGPAGTENIGLCKGGKKTCAADGKSFGACVGQVLPVPEDCFTPSDDDCNGLTNDPAAGCACTPGTMQPCYSGPAGTENVGPCKGGTQTCNAQGTGFGACVGEVLPKPETCSTPEDDDCDGQVNEEGTGCVCPPGQMVNCYTGPAGTEAVGICKHGLAQCNDQGTAMGACVGEVLPQTETCNTPDDDNCDGKVNESGPGCVCVPGTTASCYSGPAGTAGVGQCKAGTKTCNALGTAYGACTGEVLPAASETCSNTVDDNCDGQVNEGCPTVTYAANVQPILAAHCAPCHTQLGSGGGNFATSYTDSQKPSTVCAGKTKGACAIVRIQNGSMPQGAGCTGNPTLDAGKPACLTAAEQSTIQAWITGGQLP
ncbi:Hypothetical protein A7982_02454 [Minicystis rosea]|nr:Hypothetical protein A7982_02454 [Minicystis rosea]